ncbi:PREDICTED: uncharacterized protein LOC105969247 [Erythranthe guttata]|uniref:uncharacterized protein LOC105969247 n=1 Tax=Erythranthe guttata TaxID=4155 RepID=UPI00064D92E8|nr:PREDICTED: uncharacterized protein LOC105969247 [Erythranthe guttata]|eukprot:XP_012849449.1 PREDICTED: uncharacterized protein LOC105969247 [Erythranthe guttata]
MEATLPMGYIAVPFTYDGTTDSWAHVCKFKSTVHLHRFSDGIKCIAFATTLEGSSQFWYNQFLDGVIHSFKGFSSMLLDHFVGSEKQKKSALTLFIVRQERGEPLRNYIRRFTNATLNVPSLSHDILTNALLQGLKDSELFKSLTKKPPNI